VYNILLLYTQILTHVRLYTMKLRSHIVIMRYFTKIVFCSIVYLYPHALPTRCERYLEIIKIVF